MSKTNTKTAAKKSAKSTATKNGIRRDTSLGDIGKRKSSAEVVGRILERNAKRHEVGKYAGVRVAVIMPDGSTTTAPLSDYGFEQLFLDTYGEGDTPADHVRGAIEAIEDAPVGRSTRTLAAAYYRKHERPTSCVEFTDDGNAVIVRVTGKAYKNLEKIAAALNGVSWTDDDNSPLSVLDYWVGSLIRRINDTPEDCDWENVTEICEDMKMSMDTGADEGSNEDKMKRDELKAALDAVKF